MTDAEIFVPVRYWALDVFSGHRICLRSANPGQRLLLTQSRNPHSANLPPRDVIAAEIDSHLPIYSPSGLEVYVVRSYELHCRGRPGSPRPS